MKISQIERDLAEMPPRLRYWIKFQQEQIIELQQQMGIAAELMEKMFEVLNELRSVNATLNERWSRQLKGLNPIKDDGVVKSVLNEPEH